MKAGSPPPDPEASRGRGAPRLYLVTDRAGTTGRDLLDVVERALVGGVDAVQLREKDLSLPRLRELAVALLAICRRQGARLFVNDRVDLAVSIEAHGVHLPGSSFRVEDVRHHFGSCLAIGVSTHHAEEIFAAERAGADFAVFGPVFETPSKRPYGEPQGLERLREAVSTASLPVLAIGGINASNVGAVRSTGATGIAVIRAVLAADDPTAAARALLSPCAPQGQG